MHSLSGMQVAAIIVAMVCTVIVVMLTRAIWLNSKKPRSPLDVNSDLKLYKAQRSDISWIGATVVLTLLVGLTSYLAPHDEAELRAERERDMQVALKRLSCPEKRAGDTDIIVLTFDTSADLHTSKPYRASNCSRIVERGWMRQQQKPAIAAR